MLRLRDDAGEVTAPVPDHAAFHVTLDVEVHFGDRVDVYRGLELGPEHPQYIKTVLHDTEPPDENGLVWLDDAEPGAAGRVDTSPTAAAVLAALVSPGGQGVQLVGGSDGDELSPNALEGQARGAQGSVPATGLAALIDIDEIAIVAMPDTTYFQDVERASEAVDALLAHCERGRFRFALMDPPKNLDVAGVRAFRSRFDSAYAALYYPWLRISDPTPGPDPGDAAHHPRRAALGRAGRDLRPLGHRARRPQGTRQPGRARHHASSSRRSPPAEQEVLNPEGVNVLRFFEGRGNLVWGARTISSDPEWKYVNVRRLLIFLEHSIDKSTQWAVFEPNNERLWESIRRQLEAFLASIWRSGALMGRTPEEAFFVRCDRTTMTQNDLDNGRLVCLIGVAPLRPAEFVIFRIGQWTADHTGH